MSVMGNDDIKSVSKFTGQFTGDKWVILLGVFYVGNNEQVNVGVISNTATD